MNFYETVFIVRQDATTNQVETLVGDYTKIIKDFGGEVTKTEFCGLRNLAYKIKKNRKGHYVLMNLNCPPAAIVELERVMKLNEGLLRFLTLRVEELDPNPSALMQQRNYREDRYRGDFDGNEEELLEKIVPAAQITESAIVEETV